MVPSGFEWAEVIAIALAAGLDGQLVVALLPALERGMLISPADLAEMEGEELDDGGDNQA